MFLSAYGNGDLVVMVTESWLMVGLPQYPEVLVPSSRASPECSKL